MARNPIDQDVMKKVVTHPDLEHIPITHITLVADVTLQIYKQVIKDDLSQQAKEVQY